MNDLERARALREKAAELAGEKRSLALASSVLELLPPGMSWPERFVGLMLSILGLADELGIDRKACVEAFALLAENCRTLEVEGLESIDG